MSDFAKIIRASDGRQVLFFVEHGFLLRDARPLPFVPFRGRLGFFNVDPAVLEWHADSNA